MNCIDPERRVFLGVSDEEKQMLDACRSLAFGRVEVMIKDGRLIRIVRSESLLMATKEPEIENSLDKI